MDSILTYSNLHAYTEVPNESYLANTHYAAPKEPLSGSTMGLMMLLSSFQFQSPLGSAAFPNAALDQASKAAYIQSGGQAFQDNATSKVTNAATKNLREVAGNCGITEGEAAVVLGTAKVVKDRQFSLNGPQIYSIKTHLTGTPNSGIVNIKYEW